MSTQPIAKVAVSFPNERETIAAMVVTLRGLADDLERDIETDLAAGGPVVYMNLSCPGLRFEMEIKP